MLFDQFDAVVDAIWQGQAIAISRTRDPYQTSSLGIHPV
jgi:hypothetical protein